MLIAIEDGFVVVIFHAGNDIQRRNSHARIAFGLELFQGFFRRRNGKAFMGFDAVDDNMRRKGDDDLRLRMGCLNGFNRFINRSLTALGIGRTKAHNQDSILIFQALQVRVIVGQDT